MKEFPLLNLITSLTFGATAQADVDASCEDIMNSETDFITPECESFERAAKAAGLDTHS